MITFFPYPRDKMTNSIKQQIVDDIHFNIVKLLKWTKTCKKYYRRPISKQFYNFLIKEFGFNGRFKCGEEFLQHFEIPRKRTIDDNSYSKAEAFQIRIENLRTLNGVQSQPKISLRFIRIDYKNLN